MRYLFVLMIAFFSALSSAENEKFKSCETYYAKPGTYVTALALGGINKPVSHNFFSLNKEIELPDISSSDFTLREEYKDGLLEVLSTSFLANVPVISAHICRREDVVLGYTVTRLSIGRRVNPNAS